MEAAKRSKQIAEIYLREAESRLAALVSSNLTQTNDLYYAKRTYNRLIESWEMRQHGYEVLLESDRLEQEIREAFIFRDHIWNVFYNFTDYIHARNELSGVRYNLNNSNLDNSSLSVDDGLDQQKYNS